MYHSFRPGELWLDTEGKPIQAHGGSIMNLYGTYYWYGENKEKTTGETPVWHWGVRCYSSTDLYNWEDRGIIIPPEPENPESTLHSYSKMDRPHILFNKKTGKFVCWLKIMDDANKTQSMTILTSDCILGPYKKIKERFQPLGMNSGDFDLATDEIGKAYIYFEKVHSELICAELSDDYTDVTGRYSVHFPHPFPPYVREAPAHFSRNGKHYLITSGTTAYLPNPSEVAVADKINGPFTVLGNPHSDDETDTSFHSQISCIFKVQEKEDLYIAMADRWLPEYMNLDYNEYKKVFEKHFNPDFRGEINMDSIPKPKPGNVGENTSVARYVWLPVSFENDCPRIHWADEWKI